jgi:hypothetical protein
MRIYQKVNVTLTYQNCGSVWLIILRGQHEDIEMVYNGLYNFCASNGSLQYHDVDKTVATFWSNKKAIRQFFLQHTFHPLFQS